MAIRLSRTFVLRKLHQLTGIMPLGFFLLEHFYTNSKALTGPADFNNAVRDLQSIPYILFVEIGGIFIPLIYHAVYGILITAEARPNNLNYPYPRNWFYTVQRLTGIILFFFITFHVLNFRFGLIPHLNDLSVAHSPDQAFAIVSREFRMVPIFIIYVVDLAVPGRLGNHDWRARAASYGLCLYRVRRFIAGSWYKRRGSVYSSGWIVRRNFVTRLEVWPQRRRDTEMKMKGRPVFFHLFDLSYLCDSVSQWLGF